MSDYIMHSSGTWKNHKWIRREGSPGNYKYYYKTTSAGREIAGPVVRQHMNEISAEQRRRGEEIRNDQVNRMIDGMSGRNRNINFIGGRRKTKEQIRYEKGQAIREDMATRAGVRGEGNESKTKSSKDAIPNPSVRKHLMEISEEQQRRGKEIRDDQVNRMIDGMAGRTSVSPIGGRRRQNAKVSGSSAGKDMSSAAKTLKNDLERRRKGAAIRNDQVNRMIDGMAGRTVTSVVGGSHSSRTAEKKYKQYRDLYKR